MHAFNRSGQWPTVSVQEMSNLSATCYSKYEYVILILNLFIIKMEFECFVMFLLSPTVNLSFAINTKHFLSIFKNRLNFLIVFVGRENTCLYTQSQKKRTMNSLASPVTQGQGQVTPAGSYLMKYTTKFICLHSSPKDMQLSTVRFFWDWV